MLSFLHSVMLIRNILGISAENEREIAKMDNVRKIAHNLRKVT